LVFRSNLEPFRQIELGKESFAGAPKAGLSQRVEKNFGKDHEGSLLARADCSRVALACNRTMPQPAKFLAPPEGIARAYHTTMRAEIQEGKSLGKGELAFEQIILI
jgi:hypothetical protein